MKDDDDVVESTSLCRRAYIEIEKRSALALRSRPGTENSSFKYSECREIHDARHFNAKR